MMEELCHKLFESSKERKKIINRHSDGGQEVAAVRVTRVPGSGGLSGSLAVAVTGLGISCSATVSVEERKERRRGGGGP